MPKYIITYLGGDQPDSPEEGQKHFAKYKAWLAELNDAVVSPANPFKNTHTITPDGSITNSSSTRMSGYTIISADNMESALKLASNCPFLEINGTLEVSELIEMSM